MGINKQELIGKIHGIEGLSNDEKSALIELLRTHKNMDLFGKISRRTLKRDSARNFLF